MQALQDICVYYQDRLRKQRQSVELMKREMPRVIRQISELIRAGEGEPAAQALTRMDACIGGILMFVEHVQEREVVLFNSLASLMGRLIEAQQLDGQGEPASQALGAALDEAIASTITYLDPEPGEARGCPA